MTHQSGGEPAESTPKPNTGGLRHGARSRRDDRNRYGIFLTSMHHRYRSIYTAVVKLRETLENAVEALRGTISIMDTAVINLALSYEMTAKMADRQVAKGKSPSVVEDLRTACWARDKRNKELAKLGMSKAVIDAYTQAAAEIDYGDAYDDGEPPAEAEPEL